MAKLLVIVCFISSLLITNFIFVEIENPIVKNEISEEANNNISNDKIDHDQHESNDPPSDFIGKHLSSLVPFIVSIPGFLYFLHQLYCHNKTPLLTTLIDLPPPSYS